MNAGKPVPLYARVKQHLAERIAAGEWPDGAKIPSEHELMDSLGASRMTIHRALREMQAEGILRRAQGLGSFVQRQAPRSALLEITDIAEDILQRRGRHRADIITLEAIRADPETAAAFGLRKGAKLFHSVIVHHENDVPIQLEDRYVTPLFAPHYIDQDFAAQTTAAYLQSLARPTEIEHIIHAVTPDPQTQTLLKIPATEPCLQLTRRTWTAAGPATKSALTHPGSRYSLGSRYDMPGRTSKKPG
jgi:GntR family histidine utilization transcriptional repressor